MGQNIYPPVTLNITSTPQRIPIPTGDVRSALRTVTLLVHESSGVWNIVTDQTQTMGVKVRTVAATDAAFPAGTYAPTRAEIYAVSATPVSATIVFVDNP